MFQLGRSQLARSLRSGVSAVANLAEQARIRRDLRERVCALLDLADDVSVSVNRIDCPAAACLEGATAVLVMRPGCKTQVRNIAKPPEAVTDEDLRAALAGM